MQAPSNFLCILIPPLPPQSHESLRVPAEIHPHFAIGAFILGLEPYYEQHSERCARTLLSAILQTQFSLLELLITLLNEFTQCSDAPKIANTLEGRPQCAM